MKVIKNINFNRLLINKILYLKALIIFTSFLFNKRSYRKIKVGVIGLEHSHNIGNNLLKYAMFIVLSELGYDPYIVGMKFLDHNITFIQTITKLILINNSYSEIKENDYDILMVNSDQTWRKWPYCNYKYFYDIAFLKFAENWTVPKIVYGASLGINIWEYNTEDEKIAKLLLKKFKAVSVREKGSIQLIENHLGIKPDFVLDPTLLINKDYYLNFIKNYKSKISKNDKYICIYCISYMKQLISLINRIKAINNYKIFWITNIKDFIYGIYYSKGVITDSFHGTIFSIIFNKPFITLINEKSGEERFNSLKEIFNIRNRINDIDSEPDITLLEKPLYLNMYLFNKLKKKSIRFLKNNLKVYKALY
jgi:hypothetical protein